MKFRISILTLLGIMSFGFFVNGQISPNHYLVNFTDKNNSKYSITKPEKFLSPRAIARRQKYHIPININDIPVNQNYIDSLSKMGFKVINSSKWLNSVSVYTTDTLLPEKLKNISFVRSIGPDRKKSNPVVKNMIAKQQLKNNNTAVYDSLVQAMYGESYTQIKLHNGQLMHKAGYQGQGMHIAIIDGGFYKVNELPAFDSLRLNNQILGTKNFVNDTLNIFKASSHGMMVLSTMAGNIPGHLIGTAPKASYWLLRSEQTESEYIIEEHNWACAAEFADSVGVDIINSSLGYNNFDDPSTSHLYSELDGNTTMVTRAADIAASKGILVVTSAGNEGASNWRYISAPADADSVLTIGAVMKDGQRAYFSSYGPSSDKRIKPDVCALGLPSVVSGAGGQVSISSGTSFSSPIMAGLVACLWQAHPNLNNMEIIDIIKRSANRYNQPDTSLGYGIPDIYSAHIYLNSIGFYQNQEKNSILIFPNPFREAFYVQFFNQIQSIPYNLNIELFNIQGKLIWSKKYGELYNNLPVESIEELEDLAKGTYIVRLTSNDVVLNKKVVKY
ncbi:MAG: S8 family serine peptidase [Bacteroidales bacterium]